MAESLFLDRPEAGRQLVQKLQGYSKRTDVFILALARGGVPVAFEVSQALCIPLEIVIVRKLGLPGREEFAMGAIASGGIEILNKEIINILSIKPAAIEQARDGQLQELARREKAYRGDLKWPRYKADCVILIDDGLATGYSMRVAIEAARNLDVKKIIVAVPVAPTDILQEISALVDETICLSTPEPFLSVGKWYTNFNQVTDDEVYRLLQISRKH